MLCPWGFSLAATSGVEPPTSLELVNPTLALPLSYAAKKKPGLEIWWEGSRPG